MTLVLDSGGLTTLVRNRARLEELRRRGEWPALVPSVILTEALRARRRTTYAAAGRIWPCDKPNAVAAT